MGEYLYDSSFCRLCAEDNPSGVLLYNADDLEPDLSSLVNRYLPLKIQDDGKLPRTICPGCNIQLQATVQFFELLVEGQKKIRELWKFQVERERRAEKERQRIEKVRSELQLTLGEQALSELDSSTAQIFIQIPGDDGGGMFVSEHELALKMEGLERPRRKRGRPPKPKPPPEEILAKETAAQGEGEEGGEGNGGDGNPDSPAQAEEEMEEDADGRRRRRRKVPQRFKEAVQGKELERIFKEEGVIDEDEVEVEEKVNVAEQESQEDGEIIGHLETQEGQDLGELIIVSRGKGRGRPQRRRRKVRFQCDICGKGFQHKGRYFVHRSFHKGVKFECATCNKRFTFKENLDLHQKSSGHTGEGIVEGVEEGKDPEEEDPPPPAAPAENVEARFPCEQCEKTFQSRQSYEVHLKAIHEGQKPFKCEFCGKKFAYQNSLKGHMVAHETQKTDGKGYPCEFCGKLFNHPSSVVYHKEAEHNNGRRFVCNKCGKAFKHKQLLQRHQLVHSEQRPYVCKACGASFKTKANLLNHQPTHTGEKRYFCELCGQQFAHKTSLTLHYRWHTGEKPYHCQFCGKDFSQNGNLQEHLRIHTGEKPFCCNYCGRKFTTSSQFKLHIKRHTGERPWKCEFCPKTFLHKDTWKCHTRRHRGERPYQCHYCARGFTEQWALKKHLRLHTGEKPYSCNLCGKAFADCSNLTKHKKVHREHLPPGSLDSTVWNMIRSQIAGEGGSGTGAGPDGRGEDIGEIGAEASGLVMEEGNGEDGTRIQQVIFVTYQDPNDPLAAKTLHIVDGVAEAIAEQQQKDGIDAVEESEGALHLRQVVEAAVSGETNDEGGECSDSLAKVVDQNVSAGVQHQITARGLALVGAAPGDANMVSDKPVEDDELVEHMAGPDALQLTDSGVSTQVHHQTLQVMDEDGNPIQFTMQDGRQLQITTGDGQNIHVTTADGQTIPVRLTTADGHTIAAATTHLAQQLGPDGSELEGREEDGGETDPVTAMVARMHGEEMSAPGRLVSRGQVALTDLIDDSPGDVEDVVPQGMVVVPEEAQHHAPQADVEQAAQQHQQTIEFTTHDGQQVRLVASYEVDPLQLAAEYLSATTQ
ncbi:zinc finger protein 264-like [Ischnura elegans]|uniref:zinc finger protein 264-like n=1 Tax=Ischnura elegans TaxID=197161 RepID=UPI001ED8881B|nr:zinc finger protein 264-like [Ischnura elegans]